MKKNITFGLHAVKILLSKQADRVTRLCVASSRKDKKIEEIVALAQSAGITVETLTKKELGELTDEANHQGVVAFCKKSKVLDESALLAMLADMEEPAFLLILDGVTDPHNLGACFRSADAAGVHAIISTKDKAVGITPTVSKVACGATETVPFVQVTNLSRLMKKLKEQNIWLYGLAGEVEQTIYHTDFEGPIAIVMGAEGKGLRRLTRDGCDALIKIPMAGTVSSLNVSVATGIALYEVVRQRNLNYYKS